MQGTKQASLQELLTWHAEVAASYYAYWNRLAIQDMLLACGRIVAKEVGVADDHCQYAWNHYHCLMGLSESGKPLMPLPRFSSCVRGRGKERAVTVLSGDKEDDKENNKEGFEGSVWTGIEGRNNNGNVGVGSSRVMNIL